MPRPLAPVWGRGGAARRGLPPRSFAAAPAAAVPAPRCRCRLGYERVSGGGCPGGPQPVGAPLGHWWLAGAAGSWWCTCRMNRPPSERLTSTSQTAADLWPRPIEVGPQAEPLPQTVTVPETIRVMPTDPAPVVPVRPTAPTRDSATDSAPVSAPTPARAPKTCPRSV